MLNSKLAENMLGGELVVNGDNVQMISKFGHEVVDPIFYGMRNPEMYRGAYASARYTREIDVIHEPVSVKLSEVKNARG